MLFVPKRHVLTKVKYTARYITYMNEPVNILQYVTIAIVYIQNNVNLKDYIFTYTIVSYACEPFVWPLPLYLFMLINVQGVNERMLKLQTLNR